MNCSQIVDHLTKKRAFCWPNHQSNISDTSESLEDQKKQTHSWDNSNNSTHSNLFSTEWKFKKKQKRRRNKNSKVFFHRKSYTTKWTSIGVGDFFQWNQWILETWGSRQQAVYNELPNNKIEFHVTIYRFLFTFFKINWPFSSDSPFQILKAS